MERLELPDHQSVGQKIEIAPDRWLSDVQDARSLRGVPGLRVIVRNDRPQPPECGGRDAHTPLRQVALEKRLNELIAPRDAVRLGTREERSRKTTASPEQILLVRAHFREREASDADALNTTGETLRALPLELPRRTPENEEACRRGWAIHQDPQDWKEIRPTLDLVDDDQPFKIPEGGHGLAQPRETRRILQVKVVGRVKIEQLARERGLAALSWTREHDNRCPSERGAYRVKYGGASYHALRIP